MEEGVAETRPLWVIRIFKLILLGSLNDLWRFNGTHWNFIKGSPIVANEGVVGNKGVYSSSYLPRARWDAITWSNSTDHFFLFGGAGSTSGTMDQ